MPDQLFIIPLLLAAYLLFLRRKKRYTLRYSSLALIRPAVDEPSSLRRHIPTALYLLALASLLAALARPTALVNAPAPLKTIILVMDVSDSMSDNDLLPSRLKAAE